MKIAGNEYSLKFGALEIFVAGCRGVNNVHCRGCHNPQTWSFDNGIEYNEGYLDKLREKIRGNKSLITSIRIYGGEPLDQDLGELLGFLRDLSRFNLPIWLFTRYSLDEVPTEVLELIDYVKCGAYVEELKCEDRFMYGVKLATSNQYIYKM